MKRFFVLTILLIKVALIVSCSSSNVPATKYKCISGIYPHLAYYNNEGECGTGAVVLWADRLWVITYGQHFPMGSSDKLYEMNSDFDRSIRQESIGGTPANRMIHLESKQLFIGPYVIDANRNVRVIPYEKMPGRLTGNARHLKDPKNKLYCATMEEGFYEINVNNLDVNVLFTDNQFFPKSADISKYGAFLPGAHGKGLYSGQGVLIYSNNGEKAPEALHQFDIPSGSLCEWDGESWHVVRRNQFVEVTGPGGIYGNPNPAKDPIWGTGWDHKSIFIGVRNYKTGWHFYRLPKASHSYDGAHGWNTEWPRIRNVGSEMAPDYLMTMHGMFWRFPKAFDIQQTAGIRPRSAYLKVIGDFARWKNQLVFGCDDSAQKEFLNKRKQKGNIEGPGQSNSNLWFTSLDKPDHLGPVTATGSVWLNERVKAGVCSEPFLFAGWESRSLWIQNNSEKPVHFDLEIDLNGTGDWQLLRSVAMFSLSDTLLAFSEKEKGEWIRIKTDQNAIVTATFSYSAKDQRINKSSHIFRDLSKCNDEQSMGGLLYGLGDNRRTLGMAAFQFNNHQWMPNGYYELDSTLSLVQKNDSQMEAFIKEKFAIPQNVVEIDAASVLVIDDKGRRWRLPKGDEHFTGFTKNAQLRLCREVATERDLLNCHGTFYELPAENADGFAKIRPVASHDFRIHDYASYRGMLVMTGIDLNAKAGEHVIRSEDGNAAVWAGVIDDLWKMGKPVGQGGPWKNSNVKKGIPSDPYLIGFYDKKTLEISHNSEFPVTFRIEVQPSGHGPWMLYRKVTVPANETYTHAFPKYFEARWIRFVSEQDVEATAWLQYK